MWQMVVLACLLRPRHLRPISYLTPHQPLKENGHIRTRQITWWRLSDAYTGEIKMLIRKLAAISAVLVFACTISGCYEDVIDGRHVEISNGLVYQAGEDHPFTGKVTNFPEARTPFQAILNDMTVMMNRADGHSSNVLMGRNLVCTINVTEGGMDGETSCSAPKSKAVRYRIFYKKGVLDGRVELFDVTGNKLLVEADVKNGLLEGDAKRYSPTTGKLVYHARSTNNVLNGKQENFDENTGNLTYEAYATNGKYNGAIKRYSADGKLVYQGEYLDSQRVGVHQEFDPLTGKPTVSAQWDNGKLNGPVKKWDSDGNLVEDSIYHDGVKELTPSAKRPAATQGRTYGLWCNPQSDFCDLDASR